MKWCIRISKIIVITAIACKLPVAGRDVVLTWNGRGAIVLG